MSPSLQNISFYSQFQSYVYFIFINGQMMGQLFIVILYTGPRMQVSQIILFCESVLHFPVLIQLKRDRTDVRPLLILILLSISPEE